ncbi:hypothetical protein QYF36_020826 [Acer negundo]|nr:hypothetical protein QYF36_020826 [Acer negundo]
MHAAQTQRHLRSTRSPSKATTGHHAKNHRRHTFAALQLEAQHAGTGNAVPRPHTPRHDNSATGESTPDNAVWFHKDWRTSHGKCGTVSVLEPPPTSQFQY